MSTSAIASVTARFDQVRNFFVHQIWDVRLDELPKRAALGYRTARLGYCALYGLLFGDRLHLRAAALTYYTVLSVVPLLAFAFALLKGFGAYDALIEQTVRPYLLATLSGNAALQRGVQHTLDFVDRTGVASLGFFGLLALLYTATRLLRSIEGALNELWEARHARSLLQQLRDYVAIIVVTPLCLLAAGTLGTFTQLLDAVRAIEEKLGLGGLLERVFGMLGPLLIAVVGLAFLYRVMPNTSVRTRSAVIGAAIGALLWYAALILHVRFQVGVAKYNAIYAGFGLIPIFLVWTHLSWLAVMVGADLAAMHQHEQAKRQQRRAADADPVMREALCVSSMLRIARALVAGEELPTLSALSRDLDAPQPLLRELLDRMTAARLLQRSGSDDDPQWLLIRLPEHIQLKHVLDALHGTPPERRRQLEERVRLDPVAVNVLCALDEQVQASELNTSLRDLAARTAIDPSAVEHEGRR
jgi:membrane protein